MPRVYTKIQSLQTVDKAVIDMISAGVKAPATHKKPETFALWEANEKPAAVAAALAKTSLDGAYGRVCAISYSIGGDSVETMIMRDGHEKTLLQAFFSKVSKYLGDEYLPGNVTLVGFNLLGFDLRFLTRRAMIHNVKLPRWWPRDPRAWDNNICDLMIKWTGSPKEFVSLDTLCWLLGLPRTEGFDGSKVAGAWAAGDFQRVALHCDNETQNIIALDRAMTAAWE